MMRLLLFTIPLMGCSLLYDFDEERMPPSNITNDRGNIDLGVLDQSIIVDVFDVDAETNDFNVADAEIDQVVIETGHFSVHNCAELGQEFAHCFALRCDKNYGVTMKVYIQDYIEYYCENILIENGSIDDSFEIFQNVSCNDSNVQDVLTSVINGEGFDVEEKNTMNDLCDSYDHLSWLDQDSCSYSCSTLIDCYEINDNESMLGYFDWCDEICMIMDYPGQDFFKCINDHIDEGSCPQLLNSELKEILYLCLSEVKHSPCEGLESILDINSCLDGYCGSRNAHFCNKKCAPGYCNISCMSENECLIENQEGLECIILCIESRRCDSIEDATDRFNCEDNCVKQDCASESMSSCLYENGCANHCEYDSCDILCNLYDYEEIVSPFLELITKLLKNDCNRSHLMNYGLYPERLNSCSPDLNEFVDSLAIYDDAIVDNSVILCENQNQIHGICEIACEYSNNCDTDFLNHDDFKTFPYFKEQCPLLCISGFYYQAIGAFNENYSMSQDDSFDCFEAETSLYEEYLFLQQKEN
ncbi:hypothetical protein KKB55_08080 [Myxococcota bacterium]|nr:hypothetical protein [Myxococcota bacterium]